MRGVSQNMLHRILVQSLKMLESELFDLLKELFGLSFQQFTF